MTDLDILEKPGVDARIGLCFGPSATASFVATLIGEVDRELATAKLAAERAKNDALDPTLGSAALKNARGLWDDAEFRRDRLQAACGKLRERLAELKASEENTRRQKDYDRAAAERDAVAKELAGYYPEMAEKLCGLLSRLQASDFELNTINAKLPSGAPRLERAEFVAKGLVGKPVIGVSLFVSVTESRIMPWHPHAAARWPR